MAAAAFSLDTNSKEVVKLTLEDGTENDSFTRFVHVLSSVMKNEVKEELATFFNISDGVSDDKFTGDNLAFCNLLRRKQIISPVNIAPLTNTLEKLGKRHFSDIVAEMFTLFANGKLGATITEEEEKDFKRFLDSLSLLMKKEVKKGLETYFDMSDANGDDQFSGDNAAFCHLMTKKGIISPLYIEPLTTALRKCTKGIAYIVDEFFTIFKEGKFRASTTLEEEKGGDFQGFLNIFSLLMTKEVKEALESFFDVSEVQTVDECSDGNIAFCNLMQKKSIVSPISIKPVIIVLTECREKGVAKIVAEMFRLFQKGSLCTSINQEDKQEGNFGQFLNMLSLLMTNEVKEALKAFFDISKIQSSENVGNGDFCKLMAKKGIVSQISIEPLLVVLKECGEGSVAKISDTLFKLYKEGKLGETDTPERAKGDFFQRYMDNISLLMTKEVKEGLASFFDIPEVRAKGKVISDNRMFSNILTKKGIISSTHNELLTTALTQCNKSRVALIVDTLFKLFKEEKLSIPSTLEEEKGGDFQRFLDLLSLIMTTQVKTSLISFFYIPNVRADHLYSDYGNRAFCNHLKENGLISSTNNELIVTALAACSEADSGKVADKLFELFEKGKLCSTISLEEDKGEAFGRFVDILSLLMTTEVKEGLTSFFAIPEVDLNTDNVKFCKYLKEKGIISSAYIDVLKIALNALGKCPVAQIVDRLYKLYKEGKLSAQITQEEEKGEFQIFLDMLSLLMTKEVKNWLASFFDITEVKADVKLSRDNTAFCNFLQEKGIIGTSYIEVLTIAVNASENHLFAQFADELFKRFREGTLSSTVSPEVEKGGEFPKFLDMLSLLMTEEVKVRLSSLFDISEVKDDGELSCDNVAYCNHLRRKNIISPEHIELLTLALKTVGKYPAAQIADTMFKLFKAGNLSATFTLEQEREAFPMFLKNVSLLMTTKVKKCLTSLLDIPELRTGGGPSVDNVALCNLLEQRGIISAEYNEVLTIALDLSGNCSAAQTANNFFKLFKEGKLSTKITLKEDKEAFPMFLNIVSLLMTTKVKNSLTSLFDIPEVGAGGEPNIDNVAFCNLLEKKGIISAEYNEVLAIGLNSSGNFSAARTADTVFKLFKEGKLSTKVTSKEDKEAFSMFLDIVSLLMTTKVKKSLTTLFDIPEVPTGHEPSLDNVAFCNLLRKKGIISAAYSEVLTIALYSSGHRLAAKLTDNFFKLFKERKLCTSGTPEEEKEFGTFLENASPLLTDDKKSALLRIFTFPATDIKEIFSDNIKFCNYLREKHIISPKYLFLLEIVMSEVKTDYWQAKIKTTTEPNDHDHSDEVHDLTKLQDDTDKVYEKESHRKGKEGWLLSSLRATASISNLGVSLVIGDTGVELHIPPNAFHESEKEGQIQMRIIPTGIPDEIPQCFEDNATTVVEIVPNMLQLRRNATLILPHCLVLRDTTDCEVQILQSHHVEGQKPLWEDISESAQPKLHERYCEFQLREFCWIKYTIRGQSVMGKRLLLYTLGENYTADHVTATVGYIPALSGSQEVIKNEFNEVTDGTVYKSNLQGRIIGCWQSFIFRKEPAKPLKVSIEEVVPNDGWQSGPKSLKTISYSDVELSNEQSRSFTFNRIKLEAPFPVCHFEISQVDETEIHIDLAQRGHVEPINTPMVQTENTQPRGQDRRVSGALRPMSEARQVQNTEMVLSPNGAVAIRGQRHQEIILHPEMSTNAAQAFRNRFNGCDPFQRSALQLELHVPHQDLPIFSQLSYSDISKLSSCLDPSHALHKDWKILADKLGFTSGNIWNFRNRESPTEAVIFSACQSGKLRSKGQLMQILEDMERLDAILAIS